MFLESFLCKDHFEIMQLFFITDLVKTSLAKAKKLETLNAFTFLNEDQVLRDAKEADKRHLVNFWSKTNHEQLI